MANGAACRAPAPARRLQLVFQSGILALQARMLALDPGPIGLGLREFFAQLDIFAPQSLDQLAWF